MKYIFFTLFILSGMLLLTDCSTTKRSSKESISKQKRQEKDIKFYYGGTLTEVIDRAKEEDKLVFLDMTADWCAPCKLMEDEVYSYQPIYQMMNKSFISYRVNVEKGNGPNIAFLYNVKILPTLLFIDTNGRVLVKKEGSVDITTFMNLAEKALKKIQQNDK